MAAAIFGCAVGENGAVTDAASSAVLTAREKQAAEAVLTRARGERAQVRAAERIWDRDRVLRLELADGRSVVLKRRGDQEDYDAGDRSFETELAALELLSGMPVPVAPRLLGADATAGILVMEDLGRGVSLAGSLLTGERERAEADLIAYARALGSMHAWSMQCVAGPAGPEAHPGMELEPWWLTAIANGKEPFLAAGGRPRRPRGGGAGRG